MPDGIRKHDNTPNEDEQLEPQQPPCTASPIVRAVTKNVILRRFRFLLISQLFSRLLSSLQFACSNGISRVTKVVQSTIICEQSGSNREYQHQQGTIEKVIGSKARLVKNQLHTK